MIDQDLVELANKIKQRDYLAAKRAVELIAKLNEDPAVEKERKETERLTVLHSKLKRSREEAFDGLVSLFKSALAEIDDVRKNEVLLAQWVENHDEGGPSRVLGMKVSNKIWDLLREARRKVCWRCKGTGCESNAHPGEKCWTCGNNSVPGTIA